MLQILSFHLCLYQKIRELSFSKVFHWTFPQTHPPLMWTSWPGLQSATLAAYNNMQWVNKDEEVCYLLSLNLPTFKCLFPNVTLKLFQGSCFAIWAHLPDDIFNRSINDNILAEIMRNVKNLFFAVVVSHMWQQIFWQIILTTLRSFSLKSIQFSDKSGGLSMTLLNSSISINSQIISFPLVRM